MESRRAGVCILLLAVSKYNQQRTNGLRYLLLIKLLRKKSQDREWAVLTMISRMSMYLPLGTMCNIYYSFNKHLLDPAISQYPATCSSNRLKTVLNVSTPNTEALLLQIIGLLNLYNWWILRKALQSVMLANESLMWIFSAALRREKHTCTFPHGSTSIGPSLRTWAALPWDPAEIHNLFPLFLPNFLCENQLSRELMF